MMVLQSTDYGGGYTIDQLEDERGGVYYRACRSSICRYCEDEYVAHMYLEQMGWDPKLLDE